MSIFEQFKEIYFKKKYPMVGVDISDQSIELLQLTADSRIKAIARKEFSPELFNKGKITNISKLAAILKKTYEQASPKFVSKYCLLSLPDRFTFFWVFKLEKKADEKSIIAKAQEKLPIDLTKSYYDYLVTSQTEDTKEIFFVAAEKEIVDQYKQLFIQAELNLSVIDFESECLARALLEEKDFAKSVIIIDLGAKATDIVLIDDEGFRDQINIPIAGDVITRKIAEVKNIDIAQAEKIKREHNIKELNIDLNHIFEEIFFEVNKIKKNYEDSQERQVEKVVLAGGTSLLPGLKELFSKNLPGLVIELGQPDKKVQFDQKTKLHKIYYSNVIGLALRGLNNEKLNKGINLLQDITD